MTDLVETLALLSRLIRTVPAALPGRRMHLHEGTQVEGKVGRISVTVFDVPPGDNAVMAALEGLPGCDQPAIYVAERREVVTWFAPAAVAA